VLLLLSKSLFKPDTLEPRSSILSCPCFMQALPHCRGRGSEVRDQRQLRFLPSGWEFASSHWHSSIGTYTATLGSLALHLIAHPETCGPRNRSQPTLQVQIFSFYWPLFFFYLSTVFSGYFFSFRDGVQNN